MAAYRLLRQQELVADAKPNQSLADFVADRNAPVHDYLGAFAVTGGLGAEVLSKQFEADGDDYNAILVKALADRLAEAFATYLHARSRTEWGITDAVTTDDILHEKHRGIRPGFGYPACPDHSEKFKLFELLAAGDAGIALTDHAAMTPAASVSGLYFAHPQARYFTVGRVGEDQVVSYARRKGSSILDTERWLSPSLGYESSRG